MTGYVVILSRKTRFVIDWRNLFPLFFLLGFIFLPVSEFAYTPQVAGQDLSNIRSNFKKGTVVEREHRLPVLLIPLRIESSVFLVYAHSLDSSQICVLTD
jgi:hypothetical protein